MNLSQVLIGPIVTEKAYRQQDAGKYVFRIHSQATKIDVQHAVQKFLGAKVEDVNISSILKKTRVVGRGRVMTKRAAARKAIITFAEGVKIDLSKLSVAKA